MWPFGKKEKKIERIRYIDWDKVKTTEDLIGVLRNVGILHVLRLWKTLGIIFSLVMY